MAGTETFGTDSGVESTIALLEARLPEVRERRRQLEDELAVVAAQENAMVSVLQGLQTLADTSLTDQSTVAAPAGGNPAETVETASRQDEPDAAPAPARPAGSADVPTTGEPEPQATPAEKTVAKKATAKKTTAKKATAKKTPSKKTATAGTPATGTPAQDTTAEPALTAKTAGPGTAKKTTAKKAAAKKTAAKKTAVVKATAAKKTTAAEPAPSAQPQTDSTPPATPGRRQRTDAKSVLAVLTGADDPLRARQVAGLLGLDGTDSDVNAVRTMLERLARNGTAQRTGRGLYTAVSG